MNVYDFDRTIYDGDSTVDFYLFCLKRHRKIAFVFPSLVVAYIKYYIFKSGSKTQFKETMYKFLKHCDIDKDLAVFWEIHEKKIKNWYIEQRKDDDVIISASPFFLLEPIGEKTGFRVIASDVDKHNGKYSGENCYYEEKVNRFIKEYPDSHIDEFYSDHYSDLPLAKIANKAYIVSGNEISDWDFSKKIKPRI
ncbi:MAG: HAD-IB family phosphatase [Ruminococcus sp.]|nr:HAD-IB family phosphatase [Ruminococcus sp.]